MLIPFWVLLGALYDHLNRSQVTPTAILTPAPLPKWHKHKFDTDPTYIHRWIEILKTNGLDIFYTTRSLLDPFIVHFLHCCCGPRRAPLGSMEGESVQEFARKGWL